MAKVSVIRGKQGAAAKSKNARTKKLRVAAYCRVSTDSEDQLSSYESQIKYYTELINSKAEWTLAGIYADEGITGTVAYKRDQFLQMIKDCEAGKIDVVITKSISRFARNTLDVLNYVRSLVEVGTAVIFEEERIKPPIILVNKRILAFYISVLSLVCRLNLQNITRNYSMIL